jgi:hypothetical protein
MQQAHGPGGMDELAFGWARAHRLVAEHPDIVILNRPMDDGDLP